MSVKNAEWVQRYTISLRSMQQSVRALEAMMWHDMPAPDDKGELPTLNYGHVGSVIEIAKQLGDLVAAMGQVVNQK